MNKLFITVLKRFCRVFISGAIAGIVAVPLFTDFTEDKIKTYVLLVISAAITGGLMAIDKAIRWTPEQ